MSATEIYAQVETMWNLHGYEVPVPWDAGWMQCPVCRAPQEKQIFRHWRFFNYRPHTKHTIYYRCDVNVKCSICSCAYVFGVATYADMNKVQEKKGRHTVLRGDPDLVLPEYLL